MTKCKYYDCGWCYHTEPYMTNSNSVTGACELPQFCPVLIKKTREEETMTSPYDSVINKKEMTEKELIQKQIEELQTTLKLLEIEENRRTPCEKAYRDVYGKFPITDSMSGGDGDYIAWDAFQKGWEAALEYYKKETPQERGERIHQELEDQLKKMQDLKKLEEKNWNTKTKFLKHETLYDVIIEWYNNLDENNDDIGLKIDDLVYFTIEWIQDISDIVNENDDTITLKLKKRMLK